MKTKKVLLEEFSEMGSRVALKMNGNLYVEGYILDIKDDQFLFGFGGPMAPEEPHWFKIKDIDFSSLSYFSEEARKYMDACWDEASALWKITPCKPQQELTQNGRNR